MTTSSGPPVRWGILGTGGIAESFATDLQLLTDARLVAIGSRRQATADEFGDRFDVPRRHASHRDLAEDPEVDVVYVATPHPAHHDGALMALRAGKAVLCEKPFTLNAEQAADLVRTAREQRVFLMEAMWTRFLPHVVRIRELLASGDLGELRTLTAEHGQWFAPDPRHRLFDPDLGGGALLDLGVYPISFASMVLGEPSQVLAMSDPAFTGVDAQTSVLLRHSGGSHAVLTTTLEAAGPNRAAITGTDGRIEIDPTWYAPTSFTWKRRDGDPQRYDVPHQGIGLRHQAVEVARCLRAGLTESPVMPLDETVSILATMDEVRRQIGLGYPEE